MIIGGTLLSHGEKYAETVEDLPTVRRILEGLQSAIEEHNTIARSIKDKKAREDFEKVFADDVRRCEAVIETCLKRLTKEQS